MGQLSDLKLLLLDDNRLTGEFPTEMGGLADLETVTFWDNRLTWADSYDNGVLADTVALVALAEETNINDERGSYSNWFTGNPLGDWKHVTVLGGRVTELNMDSIGLTGKVPSALGNLTGLQKLNFSNNPQLGGLPSTLGRLAQLTELNLSNSGFSDAIPAELGNASNLEKVYLNNNALTGSIPGEWGSLSNLEELNLANNNLSGPVPPELANLSRLRLLYLDNNNLSGELPSQLGNLSNLAQVSVWDNNLTWAERYENGILADTVALVAFFDSANGDEWLFYVGASSLYSARSRNWLSYNPLNEWIGVTTSGGRVTELVLTQERLRRGLSGKVPPAFGLLSGLRKLDLSNQPDLTGELPATLGNLTSLQSLVIVESGISGALPPELGNLTSLENMIIVDCGLSGSLPSEFGNLANLSELHLWGNELSGSIPSELGNLGNLTKLNLRSNKLSGQIPPQLGNLAKLKTLYLDDNNLSGELPAQLGKISNLDRVSFWDNNLTWAAGYENGILADTVALVALYEATNGDEWLFYVGASSLYSAKSRNWLSYEPLRDWLGVTTSGGRVTELLLSDHRLRRGFSGNMPPALALLANLRKLDLSGNSDITGCIPASLRGIEYEGDLPFCSGSTSKKVTSPQGPSLLG